MDIHEMSQSIHDMKLLIAPFYVLIGVAIFMGGRKARDRSQRTAVYSLAAVFMLCDLAGYAGPALGLPHGLIFAAHVALPIMCLVFLFTNQHRKIFGG